MMRVILRPAARLTDPVSSDSGPRFAFPADARADTHVSVGDGALHKTPPKETEYKLSREIKGRTTPFTTHMSMT